MTIIYKELIKKYITELTPEHIKRYALMHNENLISEEIQIIFNYLLKYYKEILDGNTSSFNILKQHLRPDLYQKLEQLYNEYKVYL